MLDTQGVLNRGATWKVTGGMERMIFLRTVITRNTTRPLSNQAAGEDSHGAFLQLSIARDVAACIPEILLETDFDGAAAVRYVEIISMISHSNLQYNVVSLGGDR